jgi:ribose transport system permease protein
MSQPTQEHAEIHSRTPAPPRVERFGGHVLEHLKAAAPILVVLVLILVAIVYMNPRFIDPPVFLAFLRRAAPLLILAAGQLFVVASGGFDLSVGSLITVTVVVGAAIGRGDPDATFMVLALVLAIGIVVGITNGLVTTLLKVPSIITTLGMLLILRGAVFYWTGGSPTGALADNFRVFGREGIEVPLIGGDLPYAVLIVVVLGWGATRLLHRTTYGQQLFAAGGGARAAVMSGVNVTRIRVLAFVISSISAVIAGILLGGYSGVSAQVGQGYEFQAISAVVLGGAAIGGGRGSVVAAIVGALTLEALFMLLNLLGLPQPIRETVQGLIIIGAVVYAGLRLQKGR